jgi:hypothetical protein
MINFAVLVCASMHMKRLNEVTTNPPIPPTAVFVKEHNEMATKPQDVKEMKELIKSAVQATKFRSADAYRRCIRTGGDLSKLSETRISNVVYKTPKKNRIIKKRSRSKCEQIGTAILS